MSDARVDSSTSGDEGSCSMESSDSSRCERPKDIAFFVS